MRRTMHWSCKVCNIISLLSQLFLRLPLVFSPGVAAASNSSSWRRILAQHSFPTCLAMSAKQGCPSITASTSWTFECPLHRISVSTRALFSQMRKDPRSAETLVLQIQVLSTTANTGKWHCYPKCRDPQNIMVVCSRRPPGISPRTPGKSGLRAPVRNKQCPSSDSLPNDRDNQIKTTGSLSFCGSHVPLSRGTWPALEAVLPPFRTCGRLE